MTSRHRRAEDGPSRPRDGNRYDKALYLTESSSDTAATGDFLSRLSIDERDHLLKYGETRDYAPGEFFFRQGDPHDGIHVIASGRVRSYYTSPAGREVTLGYWTAHHFVGAPQIFGGGQHMWSSVAVEQSRGIWLPGRVLKARIYEAPDLAIALIEGLEQKAKCYTSLLQIVATRSMSKRLAHLLLTLANHEGKRSNGQVVLDRRFTHEELASMLGATRQWVSSVLAWYEDEGIVVRNGSRLLVLDEERLLDRSL